MDHQLKEQSKVAYVEKDVDPILEHENYYDIYYFYTYEKSKKWKYLNRKIFNYEKRNTKD